MTRIGRRQLVGGSVATFAVRVAGLGAALVLQLVLTRLLGESEYGIYVYVVTWATTFSLLGKFGLDTSALRFVPVYLKEQDWGRLAGFLRFALWGTGAAAVGMAAVYYGVAVLFLTGPGMPDSRAYLLGCVLVPLLVAVQVRRSVAQGLHRPALGIFPESVLYPLLAALVILAAVFLGGVRLDARAALWANLAAVVAVLGVSTLVVRRVRPADAARAAPVVEGGHWTRVSLSFLFMAGVTMINNQADVLMIGLLSDSAQVGIYAVAARLAALIIFGLTAINAVVAPVIASLYHGGQKADLQRTVILATRWASAFALAVVVGLNGLSGPILGLFGPAFTAGRWALLILSAGYLCNALVGPVGFLMTMTGHHRQAGIAVGVWATANVVLNLVLIPRFGIEGAATATTVTMAAWNATLFIYVRRNLKIRTTPI